MRHEPNTKLSQAIADLRAWQRGHGDGQEGARLKALVSRLQREGASHA